MTIEELEAKYNDVLEQYFYDEKCESISQYNSLVLEQALKEGLDNILCEIFQNADGSENIEDLKSRLDICCVEYNFPNELIKTLNL